MDLIGNDAAMPDSLRYLIILAVAGAIVYGAAWALASFPPERQQITKPVSTDRLRK